MKLNKTKSGIHVGMYYFIGIREAPSCWRVEQFDSTFTLIKREEFRLKREAKAHLDKLIAKLNKEETQ